MLKLQRMLMVLLCAGIVAAFSGCASTESGKATGGGVEKKHQSTGEYIDDAAITTKVKAALAADPLTKATQVNVETYQGVVQLSGFVDNQEMVSKAAEIAKGVEGVKSVKNNLAVK